MKDVVKIIIDWLKTRSKNTLVTLTLITPLVVYISVPLLFRVRYNTKDIEELKSKVEIISKQLDNLYTSVTLYKVSHLTSVVNYVDNAITIAQTEVLLEVKTELERIADKSNTNNCNVQSELDRWERAIIRKNRIDSTKVNMKMK